MSFRLAIFDLDGTLYRGDEAIPHAVETVAELKRRGVLVRYLTNNSSQTREFFAEKLSRMGFEAKPCEIDSSATGTASHLLDEGSRSVYLVGMPGLISTLEEAGLRVVNRGEDGHAIPQGEQADAVAAGICQEFTYALMDGAMQQLLKGARFVATNADATFPLEGGRLVPGAGSIVAGIRTCSGVEPFVVGKPNPYLLQLAMKEARVSPEETLAIGDRLDTDIESGRRAGCRTHLVLTGVEKTAPEGQSWSPDLRGVLDV